MGFEEGVNFGSGFGFLVLGCGYFTKEKVPTGAFAEFK